MEVEAEDQENEKIIGYITKCRIELQTPVSVIVITINILDYEL